ncbi:MAG: hypothetical protein FWH02_00035 [Oscillospiraceae bacterium]|nr:hypothetical protein [Oscillospiraceae bacterium]
MAVLTNAMQKLRKVYGNGKLEKALVVRYVRTGKSFAVKDKIRVQFNPAEYSITRSVRQSAKQALGRDISSEGIQTVSGETSLLTLSLYFDSYTELKSDQGVVNYAKSSAIDYLKSDYNTQINQSLKDIMPSADLNEDLSPAPDLKVNERFTQFLDLIKYEHEGHEPPHIGFIWGDSVFFVGKVISQNTQYTVFDRDGTPVRARMTLTIAGEDIVFDQKRELYPMESPNRTKQRSLRYGDRLWMLAQEEYGDPARWKTIAEANNILNPRLAPGPLRLQVPSIR